MYYQNPEFMNVLFFGPLAEITGHISLEFDPCPDTDTLMNRLLLRFPALRSIPVKMALNQEVVIQNRAIAAGDELALLAPFAGG
jgi:molybdopterin converting factor small subunit